MDEHGVRQTGDSFLEVDAVMQCNLEMTSLHHSVGADLVLALERQQRKD
jgi:hypothetical protein